MDDLIRKNDVIWTLRNTLAEGTLRRTLELRIRSIKPNTAKWEAHPTERAWDVCSCCHVGTKRREYGADNGREWFVEYTFSYCPNCGARMEE